MTHFVGAMNYNKMCEQNYSLRQIERVIYYKWHSNQLKIQGYSKMKFIKATSLHNLYIIKSQQLGLLESPLV